MLDFSARIYYTIKKLFCKWHIQSNNCQFMFYSIILKGATDEIKFILFSP